ncbi:uncharacterized protein METZ01_LOCUS364627 [marine metagenome]|uniref:Uncharacterized protein n=1 Tax=marine metagenome TaxID=408172 RepID=A0A382SPP2_9ZZZZ
MLGMNDAKSRYITSDGQVTVSRTRLVALNIEPWGEDTADTQVQLYNESVAALDGTGTPTAADLAITLNSGDTGGQQPGTIFYAFPDGTSMLFENGIYAVLQPAGYSEATQSITFLYLEG